MTKAEVTYLLSVEFQEVHVNTDRGKLNVCSANRTTSCRIIKP